MYMKRWYVVQVYAGYEEVVKKDLEKRIQEEGLQDILEKFLFLPLSLNKFLMLLTDKDQQLFPGYILIEMEVAPETCVWLLQAAVLRFLGGKEPVPLSKKKSTVLFRK